MVHTLSFYGCAVIVLFNPFDVFWNRQFGQLRAHFDKDDYDVNEHESLYLGGLDASKTSVIVNSNFFSDFFDAQKLCNTFFNPCVILMGTSVYQNLNGIDLCYEKKPGHSHVDSDVF